jgi:hypothetical protein
MVSLVCNSGLDAQRVVSGSFTWLPLHVAHVHRTILCQWLICPAARCRVGAAQAQVIVPGCVTGSGSRGIKSCMHLHTAAGAVDVLTQVWQRNLHWANLRLVHGSCVPWQAALCYSPSLRFLTSS